LVRFDDLSRRLVTGGERACKTVHETSREEPTLCVRATSESQVDSASFIIGLPSPSSGRVEYLRGVALGDRKAMPGSGERIIAEYERKPGHTGSAKVADRVRSPVVTCPSLPNEHRSLP
jgi:hypothetical protein